MESRSQKKIAVALSGGVDSAVAAALLIRDGRAPTAFFARGWSPKESRCDWAAEERDAMRVAAFLGIPFRSLDLGHEYERQVVGPLVDGYRRGLAVNPDVWCNKAIKFGALLEAARREGFEELATGHYARREDVGGEARLYRGADAGKDQSYFLWALGQEQLQAARFPLGAMRKDQVRALARDLGIPVAEKPDSQGVCFVGEMDFKDFLRARLRPIQGDAVDEFGAPAGRHDGAALYVPGERISLEETRPDLRGAALYVISKNVSDNRLTVGLGKSVSGGSIIVSLDNLSETVPGSLARAATCQLRYRTAPVRVTGKISAAEAVLEASPVRVAPGQSAVFYAEDGECLGGGEVSVWRSTEEA